jgi:hypothetical protein
MSDSTLMFLPEAQVGPNPKQDVILVPDPNWWARRTAEAAALGKRASFNGVIKTVFQGTWLINPAEHTIQHTDKISGAVDLVTIPASIDLQSGSTLQLQTYKANGVGLNKPRVSILGAPNPENNLISLKGSSTVEKPTDAGTEKRSTVRAFQAYFDHPGIELPGWRAPQHKWLMGSERRIVRKYNNIAFQFQRAIRSALPESLSPERFQVWCEGTLVPLIDKFNDSLGRTFAHYRVSYPGGLKRPDTKGDFRFSYVKLTKFAWFLDVLESGKKRKRDEDDVNIGAPKIEGYKTLTGVQRELWLNLYQATKSFVEQAGDAVYTDLMSLRDFYSSGNASKTESSAIRVQSESGSEYVESRNSEDILSSEELERVLDRVRTTLKQRQAVLIERSYTWADGWPTPKLLGDKEFCIGTTRGSQAQEVVALLSGKEANGLVFGELIEHGNDPHHPRIKGSRSDAKHLRHITFRIGNQVRTDHYKALAEEAYEAALKSGMDENAATEIRRAKIAEGEQKVSLVIMYCRALPEDARIAKVELVGSDGTYQLCITLNQIVDKLEDSGPALAVHIGWRSLGDGLVRAAVIYDPFNLENPKTEIHLDLNDTGHPGEGKGALPAKGSQQRSEMHAGQTIVLHHGPSRWGRRNQASNRSILGILYGKDSAAPIAADEALQLLQGGTFGKLVHKDYLALKDASQSKEAVSERVRRKQRDRVDSFEQALLDTPQGISMVQGMRSVVMNTFKNYLKDNAPFQSWLQKSGAEVLYRNVPYLVGASNLRERRVPIDPIKDATLRENLRAMFQQWVAFDHFLDNLHKSLSKQVTKRRSNLYLDVANQVARYMVGRGLTRAMVPAKFVAETSESKGKRRSKVKGVEGMDGDNAIQDAASRTRQIVAPSDFLKSLVGVVGKYAIYSKPVDTSGMSVYHYPNCKAQKNVTDPSTAGVKCTVCGEVYDQDENAARWMADEEQRAFITNVQMEAKQVRANALAALKAARKAARADQGDIAA